jgi:hypothetical protein
MVVEQIPNLILAHSEPGRSEPTKMGEYVIAKRFSTSFEFQDGAKTWSAEFNVTVSDLGTPKLTGVMITGSRLPHPKPLPTNTYTFENRHELDEITQGKRKIYSDEQLDEHTRLMPEADSVERWQIKVIEQYRFQLLELAIRLAVEMGEPGYLDYPSGVDRWWSPIAPLGVKEIKALQKSIDQRLRKKITPELLRKVAEIYTEAGLRKEKPVKAVQENYKCAYRTAQDYVTYARAEGFLPPTTPGKVTVRKTKKRKGKS